MANGRPFKADTMTLLSCISTLFVWYAAITPVTCLPYMLLTNTRPKCVAVIAAQGQTITIAYKMPDMVLPGPDENNEDANTAVDAKGGDAKVGKESVEAMDARWNQKMKEKLERMKTKKVRDMSITVTQKGGMGLGALASRQRRTMMSVDDRIRMSGQGRVREELNERSGEIDFRTGDSDGKVDICVQSLSASNDKPSRFALNVTVHHTEAAELEEEDAKKRRAEESSKAGGTDGKVLEQNQVKTQISRLERDMQTLNNRIQTILSNADYNKDQEVSFHTQSVNMNKASTYWPIIQLIVIVITGFTQANHIVKFMRTRHIGY